MVTDERMLSRLKSYREMASVGVAGRVELNNFYEGELALATLGVNIPSEINKVRTVFNYPRIVVDSLDERLDVEGFRLAGSDSASDALWDIWQRNNLDEESAMGHIEAMVQGDAIILTGVDGSGRAAVTVHESAGWAVSRDRISRQVVEAYQEWVEGDDRTVFATLYGPVENHDFVFVNGVWTHTATRKHGLGEVPVTVLANRSRLRDLRGRTEMADVIPFTVAAMRALTNLQVASERVALPQRLLFGAQEEDFMKKDGSTASKWEAYIGHILMLEDENAKAVEFSGADLRNFHETINAYSRAVAAVAGLPPHYLGIIADSNPSSADAIVADEARLVKKAERKQRVFGGAWERAMRLAAKIEGVEVGSRLESVWRDAATPTIAQKVDAVMKLRAPGADGQSIISAQTAREMIGMSPEASAREAERLRIPELEAVGLG